MEPDGGKVLPLHGDAMKEPATCSLGECSQQDRGLQGIAGIVKLFEIADVSQDALALAEVGGYIYIYIYISTIVYS